MNDQAVLEPKSKTVTVNGLNITIREPTIRYRNQIGFQVVETISPMQDLAKVIADSGAAAAAKDANITAQAMGALYQMLDIAFAYWRPLTGETLTSELRDQIENTQNIEELAALVEAVTEIVLVPFGEWARGQGRAAGPKSNVVPFPRPNTE